MNALRISSFARFDRRVIYLLVALALSIPLLLGYTVKAARMQAAESVFTIIEGMKTDDRKIAFLSLDFGPGTKAENAAQAEVLIEHLMRKRIPFIVVSLIAESTALLTTIPEGVARKLMAEQPGERWQYGKDWVNFGYLAGGSLAIQSLSTAPSIAQFFKKDVRGNNADDLPALRGIKGIRDVSLLGEITGSPGALEVYLQFFQLSDYRPLFAHGCTSISTPQAYIYLDSGQLNGLFEGIAGAAWYSELLRERYPTRQVDSSLMINTGLGIAHLVIIALILLGNLSALFSRGDNQQREGIVR